ncbi:cytochrome c assembly protein [Plesiocystis pacifica SIR-1]|uniref:Heme exporter protein C n=2 Tax=Plesiocystis pacifica TaxID=191768 RepID=A6GHX3_9BACT|nr:cytochrome c assembly protein [Plesiocystis pacifica SIR-1]
MPPAPAGAETFAMKHVPYFLLANSAALFPYCVYRVFLMTPIEREMGTAQKIFYFHVPLAWICMLFAMVCGIAAAVQLRRRSERAEALAVAAGEMTVLAGLGVLITGPIWGDATWGTPWTGDARQVSTALLWMIFVAYLLVRRFGPANSERLAAALAIFGAIDVPIIYYAVKIWKTTHPSNTVVGSLPQTMWNSLWWCLGALLLLAISLVWIRARQERIAIGLDEAWIEADERDPNPAAAVPARA